MKNFIFILILSHLVFQGQAQHFNVNLNHAATQWLDRQINAQDEMPFTTAKPLLHSVVKYDTLWKIEFERQKFKTRTSWLGRIVKNQSLIDVKGEDFTFSLDPVFNFEASRDLSFQPVSMPGVPTPRSNYTTNTRGFFIRGTIGKRLAFESDFYESQSFFPNYIDIQSRSFRVVPGQGAYKGFKTNGFDYNIANAYISVAIIQKNNHILNIQFGHGKQFVGDGYRSWLLSDAAFNYPSLKINYQNKYFQYISNFATLQDLIRTTDVVDTEQLYIRKFFNYHYASIKLGNLIQLGLFEAIIFQKQRNFLENNTIVTREFKTPSTFFIPLLGLNSAATNGIFHMLALTAKVKLWSKSYFYGQYVFDTEAYQAGIKIYDLFTIKNLHIQAEYNQAEANIYSSIYPFYGNYQQFLGHPAGSGLKEYVARLHYNWSDFNLDINAAVFNFPRPVITNMQGIEQIIENNESTYNYEKTKNVNLQNTEIRFSYTVNRKSQARIGFYYVDRFRAGNQTSSNKMVGVFFSTHLRNLYYDFF
jgi:hypothetical protein